MPQLFALTRSITLPELLRSATKQDVAVRIARESVSHSGKKHPALNTETIDSLATQIRTWAEHANPGEMLELPDRRVLIALGNKPTLEKLAMVAPRPVIERTTVKTAEQLQAFVSNEDDEDDEEEVYSTDDEDDS